MAKQTTTITADRILLKKDFMKTPEDTGFISTETIQYEEVDGKVVVTQAETVYKEADENGEISSVYDKPRRYTIKENKTGRYFRYNVGFIYRTVNVYI